MTTAKQTKNNNKLASFLPGHRLSAYRDRMAAHQPPLPVPTCGQGWVTLGWQWEPGAHTCHLDYDHNGDCICQCGDRFVKLVRA